MAHPAHLEPSELGTKEYWNNLYTSELSNHAADPNDTGTCWFDDSNAEAHILRLLSSLSLDSSTSFLDLGCGNGSLLFALQDDGWSGRMLGVDYSPQSIALASQIASTRTSTSNPSFAEWDLIHGPEEEPAGPGTGWHVVLDKGTFDAICLSEQRPADVYRQRILGLLKQGGLFVVTSCNWTEAELRAWFEGDALTVVKRVDYPTFTFGGVKGQTITTLCFRRA